MTRDEFKKTYTEVLGTYEFQGRFWKTHRDNLRELPTMGCVKDYILQHNEVNMDCCKTISNTPTFTYATDYITFPSATTGVAYVAPTYISLGDCKPCTPPRHDMFPEDCYQEQGNNPMRIETNSATAVVSAIQSDESIQRSYLLDELKKITDWRDQTQNTLIKMFNINAPKYPKSSQELLDAFSKSAYTVDQAKVDENTKLFAEGSTSYDDDEDYVGRKFYGITFTSLPVADYDGYKAALEAYEKAKTNTKRAIIVGSPADGLAALVALEAWTPANAPTVTTVQ